MGNQSHRFAAAPSLATAFAALVPGFVHVMGTVYNDGLSFLTVAIACNVATRLVLDGFTWRRVAALSVALSVAVLTRFSGLFVVACGLAAFVCSGWLGEDRQTKSRWWRTLGAALLVLAAVIATSCWFYWRNYRLYGDPSGATALLEIFGRAARALVLVKRGEALWPSRCVACLSLLATMLFALYGYSIFAFYARGGSPYARYLFPALPVIAAAIALALDSLRLQTAAVIAISALVFTNLVNLAGFARSLDKLGAHGLVLQTSLATNGHERTAVKEPAHGSRPVSRDW